MLSTAEKIETRAVRILVPGPIGYYFLEKLRNDGIPAKGRALAGDPLTERLKLEIEDKLYKDFSYEGPFAFLIEVEGNEEALLSQARRFWYNPDTPEYYAWFRASCSADGVNGCVCYPPRRKERVSRYYDYSEIAELLEERNLENLFPEGTEPFLVRGREALEERDSGWNPDPIRRSEGWFEDEGTLVRYLKEMITLFSDDITLFFSKARKIGAGRINLYLKQHRGERPLEGITAFWGSHFLEKETDMVKLSLMYDRKEDTLRVAEFGPYFQR